MEGNGAGGSTGGSGPGGGGLSGRLAVVTGGARGIGRAICETLARDGADVVVADLDLRGAEETAGLVRGAGRAAAAYRLDVADEPAVEAFFRA